MYTMHLLHTCILIRIRTNNNAHLYNKISFFLNYIFDIVLRNVSPSATESERVPG